METENITFRRIRRSSSLKDISALINNTQSNTSLFDATMTSLPNTSLNDTQTYFELNEKIQRLTTELQSAHLEIEKLNSENHDLNSELQKAYKVIENYKKVCTTPTSIPIPKKKSCKVTPSGSKSQTPSGSKSQTHKLPQPRQNCTSISKNTPRVKTSKIISKKHIEFSTPEFPTTHSNVVSSSSVIKDSGTTPEKNQEKSHKSSVDIPTEPPVPDIPTSQKQAPKSKIIILGDEHLLGLSASIIKTRSGKWNDNYQPSAIIKSEAPSSQILNYCDDKFLSSITENDIVILGVGGHDENLTKLESEIHIALHKLKTCTVYIAPLYFSKHFNVKLLNNRLMICSKVFPKCKYINIHCHNDKQMYLRLLCNKINLSIDSDLYTLLYLNPKRIIMYGRENCIKNNCRTKVNSYKTRTRQMTIKDYFHITKHDLNAVNSSHNNKRLSSTTLDEADPPRNSFRN